jgi:putative copper resistance protein D
VTDPLVYARFIHFAATIAATGVAFFVVLILGPAARRGGDESRVMKALRAPLAVIAWTGLAIALLSGVAWLVLTAASMSGQSVADALSPDVLWIVLSQTTFGNAWLLRFVLACGLAAAFVRLLSAEAGQPSWLRATAIALAAAFVGSLAWAGHAIGGQGIEGVLHPVADVLHLIAAAVWLGMLVPLALLLGLSANDAAALATMRAATLRFSTLGLVSVGTLLATGIVNTWYLAGSIAALLGTDYGRLLLLKIALFLLMVGVAAVNRLRLTPKLVDDRSPTAAQHARRQLRRNATIEASLGAVVIAVVAVLGTLPPASHSHHASELAIPVEASFQHIHTGQGMADIVIEPGRVGTAAATIHLSNDDGDTLAAREVTLTLTAPTSGSKATRYVAERNDDDNWQIDGVVLSEPGDWSIEVDALLGSGQRLALAAGIVIEAK